MTLMQQSILVCWIYPNQFCNLSEIRHKRAGVWKHRPVPDESPSASLQGANLFVCLRVRAQTLLALTSSMSSW